MKIVKCVTLNTSIVEKIKEIAENEYLGNFSMAVEILLEKSITERSDKNARIET